MAATLVKLTSAMILKARVGVDGNGNDVYKNITLKKIKPAVTDQDVFEVSQAIALILSPPVESVLRQNLNEIING
jgi:hypothetical protein